MKKEHVGLLVLCLYMVVFICFTSLTPPPEIVESKPVEKIHVNKNLSNSVNTYLHLQIIRDGEVVKEFWKKDDLLLSNYCNWTMMTLSGRTSICYLKDDQGERKTVSQEEDEEPNTYIAIGTGTNAVTFTDYALQTETNRTKVDDWLIAETGTSYNLTATASFTFSQAYNITECGFCYHHSDFGDEVFLTRDTFSAQEVAIDDTLAVSIIIEFTGGITNNYGKHMATMLYGEIDEQYNPKDTNGAANEYSSYWTVSNTDWEVCIGTGTGAFTLDDFVLADKKYDDAIIDADQVIYSRSGNDVNITVIGYFSIDATYDIAEVGITTPLHDEEVLLCREVLGTPWSVVSGDNIAVYVTWIIDQ